MQSVSSRIWTPVAMSISYNDNHYTLGTSLKNDIICGRKALSLMMSPRPWKYKPTYI